VGLRAGLYVLRTDKRFAAAYIRTPDFPANTAATVTAVPDPLFHVIFQSKDWALQGTSDVAEVLKLTLSTSVFWNVSLSFSIIYGRRF
jgi:hypothetical protein